MIGHTMENEYTLDDLIEKFSKHASKYREDYRMSDPGLRGDYFNLPLALILFAMEIKDLKEKSK